MKSRGPKMEPCGTPWETLPILIHREFSLSLFTWNSAKYTAYVDPWESRNPNMKIHWKFFMWYFYPASTLALRLCRTDERVETLQWPVNEHSSVEGEKLSRSPRASLLVVWLKETFAWNTLQGIC